MADAKIRITAEDRTKVALRSAQKNIDSFTASLTGMKGQLTSLVGVAGLGAFLKANIDLGDQLSKTSEKVGISVERLSAYQYAAKLAGVSNEELTSNLARLAKAMQEATQDRGGETAQFFRSLGVAITDTNGRLRDTGAVFEDVSRVFANAKDGPEKTAAAMKLLGKSGAEMIPLMNNLEKTTGEAKRLGLVVGTDFAKASERFNDELERMKVSMGTFLATSERGSSILDGFLTLLKYIQAAGMVVAETFQALGSDMAAMAGVATEAARGEFSAAIRLWKMHRKDMEELAARGKKAREELFSTAPIATDKPDRKDRITLPTDRKADDKLLSDAQGIGASLMTEEEKIRSSYANRAGILLAAREQELISQATFNETKERLDEEHGFKMIGLTSKTAEANSRLWASGLQGRVDLTKSMLGDLSGLMQSSSEKMFKIGKAAALSNAAISTGEAMASALATKPFFPLGLAMFGVAALKGKATIDQIKSQSFGGGGSSGSFSASPSSGLPTQTDISSNPLPVAPQAPPRSTVNLTIVGSQFSYDQVVNEIIPLINEANGNGADIRVSTG